MASAASSSGSSGSMSNMSRLLASSRLSSYHPRISQVYTAPRSHISRGDFGVKRPLPTINMPIGKIRYIEINNQDSKEGQTEWMEREREVLLLRRFAELNVQLETKDEDLRSSQGLYNTSIRKVGSLGPKINTTFDPSTRRAVPTSYQTLADGDVKTYLQSESRLGRGALKLDSLYGSEYDGPFGRSSSDYTDAPATHFNFRSMNERQFQQYLEDIRSRREAFKDHLASRAGVMARARVAKQYEKQRASLLEEARKAEATGATKVEVAPPIYERDLPLPPRSDGKADAKAQISIDLWDEARRLVDAAKSTWDPWLHGQNVQRIRGAESQTLPRMSNGRGGDEITTQQHAHGGLQYSQPDIISTQLLYNSLPARVLGKAQVMGQRFPHRTSEQEKSVAVAGRIANMPTSVSDGALSIDPSGNEPNRGNIQVRVVNATRHVKKDEISDLNFKRFAPSDADGRLPPRYGNTVLTVRNSTRSDHNNMTKGLPGSSEWVARLDGAARQQSSQGDDYLFDLTGMNSIYHGATAPRRTDVNDSRYARLSETERARKTRRDRLNSPTSSGKDRVKHLYSTVLSSWDKNLAETEDRKRSQQESPSANKSEMTRAEEKQE